MSFIPIPAKIRKQIDTDPFYEQCALSGHEDHLCGGRITMEHAIEIRGKRLQTLWAIIPICARGHEVDEYQDAGTMDKHMNQWVALNRATDQELFEISKLTNFKKERDRLNKKYGPYTPYIPKYEMIGVKK